MDPAAAPSLTDALRRAQALLASDPTAAGREAEAALRHAPNDPRAALILAVARRRLGDAGGALAVLRPLAGAFPNDGLTQYELGLALAACGEEGAALAALRRATELMPDQPDPWRALGDLLFRRGDNVAAADAFAQHARASVTDPRLKDAAAAAHAGRLMEAETMLRTLLAAGPDDIQALALLGDVLARQGRDADAELALARCLQLEPRFDGARFGLASALFRQQKMADARPHLEQLAKTYPGEAAYLNLLAATLVALGEYDPALALYASLVAAHERQPLVWLNHAHCLRTVGRIDESVAAYRRAIALDEALGEAYLGLANLKVAAFADAEVEAMRALIQRRDLTPTDRQQLAFALGKALEDRGEHASSFARYAEGAALRRAEAGYDAGANAEETRRAVRLFTPDFFAERADVGVAAGDPIFIVGLPRSGSTLIEQILASHSQVEGTAELPDLGFIARSLGPWPEGLATLTAAKARELGERYLAATRVHRKLGRPFFIDKMPDNFRYVALIRLILPNAKVIDARRHPMATCFSCFKQHFLQGQAFTYDLVDLGGFYRDYMDLMAQLDAALPGWVRRVIYEDLVDDTEGEIRALLDWLGLPFEPACLRFYETERAVRTVSSEQVRRPIFREGLDQWRNYEPWLGPLKDALGPALEAWR